MLTKAPQNITHLFVKQNHMPSEPTGCVKDKIFENLLCSRRMVLRVATVFASHQPRHTSPWMLLAVRNCMRCHKKGHRQPVALDSRLADVGASHLVDEVFQAGGMGAVQVLGVILAHDGHVLPH